MSTYIETLARKVGAYTINTVPISGYYWWLPVCFIEDPYNKCNWSLVFYDDNIETSPKNGLLIGPIVGPKFLEEESEDES